MRIPSKVLPIAFLVVVTTGAAMTTAHRRMYPNLTIFRAGGLRAPVALQHCCVTIVNVNGRSGASLSGDTLAMIYEDLTPTGSVPPDGSDSTQVTAVAEFFGSSPLPTDGNDNVSTLRRPDLPRLFGQATHHSWIYPGSATRPPIWESPVVAPGGANDRYYAIGASAEKILASLGVRVR